MNRTAPIVLGLSGSPRRTGNTATLINELLRGARDVGASTELLSLADLDIRPCTGCETCVRTGACAQIDDLSGVAEKMSSADIWIMGTPVYLFSPTALCKAFLERWISLPDPTFSEKSAILVIPFAADSIEIGESTATTLRRCFTHKGVRHIETILGPGLLDRDAARGRPELLLSAYELGRRAASPNREAS